MGGQQLQRPRDAIVSLTVGVGGGGVHLERYATRMHRPGLNARWAIPRLWPVCLTAV